MVMVGITNKMEVMAGETALVMAGGMAGVIMVMEKAQAFRSNKRLQAIIMDDYYSWGNNGWGDGHHSGVGWGEGNHLGNGWGNGEGWSDGDGWGDIYGYSWGDGYGDGPGQNRGDGWGNVSSNTWSDGDTQGSGKSTPIEDFRQL